VGSAATLIGNPQNMLIGQQLQLSFRAYLLDGAPVAAIGLFLAWAILCRAYRNGWDRATEGPVHAEPAFDRWQTIKGLAVLALLTIGLVATSVPRMATRSMLGLVDWQLCVLFGGLFVVNHALTAAGHTAAGIGWLQQQGVDLTHAPSLFAVTALGSNVISNVPLVMLLLQPAQEAQAGPLLALVSTLSGNLLLVGSIANLIVVEQASLLGVAPRQHSWVREHMRTGIPITLATLGLAAAWLAVRG
jgi:Na+/H+ antiporter NhaD/arsenite permease-like protein